MHTEVKDVNMGINTGVAVDSGVKPKTWNPHRLISDEEFEKNMTCILTFYNMIIADKIRIERAEKKYTFS